MKEDKTVLYRMHARIQFFVEFATDYNWSIFVLLSRSYLGMHHFQKLG